MIYVVEKAFDVGFNHIPIAAKLEFIGEVFDRLLCASLGTIPVADGEEVLFENGLQ